MARDSVVLLIRHGEKHGDPCDDGGGHPGLNEDGKRRAERYVEYFRGLELRPATGSGSMPFTPAHVFAASDSHHSHRPRLTASPLAQALKLDLDCSYAHDDHRALADHLGHRRYDGKHVLVCWHHGKLLALAADLLGHDARHLGRAASWPDEHPCTAFGWVYQLVFDSSGSPRSDWVRCYNSRLMPADTVAPPG